MRVGCHSGHLFHRSSYPLSPIFLFEPAYDMVVLLVVECTCTVYEIAAGAQCGPKIREYLALAPGTFAHQGRRPL